ncbi:Beta-glucosidase 4 [Zea mays]|uniref:Beta-glucosidase 4 n=1 Tax=Zea mays TaxID=4577 RepID=A0A3L6DMF8_MAIZE|nr:Beta-glucosidase 4 [Zea mays]
MGSTGREPEVTRANFPDGFVFGVATSAYQIEGARREGGKGDSIWDVFTDDKERVLDRSNAEIAVDHYHRYKEDIELMASLGFSAYRFSISWARIFPDGFGEKVNEQGVAFYNDLINFMISKGIEPYATLYHWDLPNNLQKTLGGWISDKIVEYFALYAEACFANFGDRVKRWITINEPLQTAINGYGIGIFAPGGCQGETARCYLAAHHQILAHAAAVDVYRRKFKAAQGGEVGLVVDCEWAEPFSEKLEDQIAAQRRIDFQLGWYLDPIYFGDYPESMRQRLGSDLPTFSEKDKEFIRNKIDFIGLNHYTSRLIAHHQNPDDVYFYKVQQMERKNGVVVKALVKGSENSALSSFCPRVNYLAASEWLVIVPWGLHKLLNYIVKKYNNPVIYVTENGMDDEDDQSATIDQVLNDTKRVGYFKGYLNSVAQAIKDGADVRGYFAWSFLDNFEWAMGYTKRFGIVYVDYKDGLSRHPKASALWFSRLLKGEAAENSYS